MDSDVVPSSIAHPAPKARSDRYLERLRRESASLLEDPFPVPDEPRIAVHTVELERHPVRTEIAFLKDVGPDAPERRDASRRGVVRSTVAEQQYVGHLMLAKEIVEEHRPVPETAAEVRCRLIPVDHVAGAYVDPLDLDASASHRHCKLMHHWAGRPLQEHECTPLRPVHGCARPPRGGVQQKTQVSGWS